MQHWSVLLTDEMKSGSVTGVAKYFRGFYGRFHKRFMLNSRANLGTIAENLNVGGRELRTRKLPLFALVPMFAQTRSEKRF